MVYKSETAQMTHVITRNISTSVALPDGGVIAISNCLIGDEDKIIPIYDHNHNIFRLDKDGKVIWQVQRDDKGAINWERIMAEVAKGDKGDPETIRRARKPFTTLYLLDSDGNDLTKTGKWVDGLTLYGLSVNYGGRYQIDIDTGIATNITESPTRDW